MAACPSTARMPCAEDHHRPRGAMASARGGSRSRLGPVSLRMGIARRAGRLLVFALLRFSGIPFVMRQIWQRHRVTIVVYHAVSRERATVHFRALQQRYNIIA